MSHFLSLKAIAKLKSFFLIPKKKVFFLYFFLFFLVIICKSSFNILYKNLFFQKKVKQTIHCLFGSIFDVLKNKMEKMKTYNKVFLVLIIFFIGTSFTYKDISIPDGVIEAIKTGNSKQLANYFNSSINLVILESNGVYTKKQSEIIIGDFFSEHQPNGFQIIHEGEQLTSSFVIGRLKSYSGFVFRVYFLMQRFDGENVITEFKIELE